ncbi:hypothetical protein DB35_23055 [Streptomyces abyssalis]|uniref:DUF397 domain-containing protein n=2 Tax=Streptomyces abyssalis TaxID=933944 RepID=A0A1E7JP37_9ACTN|nr:DUF397 domain-containing protein [Streptomyces abyssalis]OEU86587.1 hypothetical protein DB35_23055 [Streptomyces abyssalis]OEU90026.1 hypothetical protein AN215_10465 [Streptomyces abyssalis]
MMTCNDLSGAEWHKSSYSNGDGGNCVEVACGLPGLMPVRDSKRAGGDGAVIVFPAGGWYAFVDAVKRGQI